LKYRPFDDTRIVEAFEQVNETQVLSNNLIKESSIELSKVKNSVDDKTHILGR